MLAMKRFVANFITKLNVYPIYRPEPLTFAASLFSSPSLTPLVSALSSPCLLLPLYSLKLHQRSSQSSTSLNSDYNWFKRWLYCDLKSNMLYIFCNTWFLCNLVGIFSFRIYCFKEYSLNIDCRIVWILIVN